MNDVDRWVNLEGPEPRGIRELLDAACDVPELSNAEAERMKRAVHLALAEQDRRFARRRRLRWALGGSLVITGAAAAVAALVIWLKPAAPLLDKKAVEHAIEVPLVPASATATARRPRSP